MAGDIEPWVSHSREAAEAEGIAGTVRRRRGRVWGYVRDEEGRPVAGAGIRTQIVASRSRYTKIGWVPHEDGWYSDPNIRGPGTYRLTAWAPGYEVLEQEVVVPARGVVQLDFTLRRL